MALLFPQPGRYATSMVGARVPHRLAAGIADQFIDVVFFFFNDTATNEIYTLSLHDALPISRGLQGDFSRRVVTQGKNGKRSSRTTKEGDRKSTRLNSSHPSISYAVFCL